MKIAIVAGALAAALPAPSPAYLFWVKPDFTGAPVRGDEPGIADPLPGATPAEIQANLVWTLRAALNVAALQCQFAPTLMTVRNYNTVISQHGEELTRAYVTVGNYFRRTAGKNWQRLFDSYSTRSYNGLSTMHAQYGFCETAGQIGKIALDAPRGQFHSIAETNMRAVRNSLVPKGDRLMTLTSCAACCPTRV